MLIAVGLDQKCASVADRERLAVERERLAEVLREHAARCGLDECVLLSTCYRVEIYASTSRPGPAAAALRGLLCERAGGPLPLFELREEAALRHLFRVAASLESAVLGEPQILGQVKEALQRARDSGACGRELAAAFERAFQVAKRVRTDTEIGRSGVSWGSAAAELASKVLGRVEGRRVVVLGAGEMARLSAQHLRGEGAEVVVLNRTAERAEELAREVGGAWRPLEALGEELLLADVVVSAAPASPPELAPAALAAALRARRRRDLVLVDLAVPRAIPAASGAIDGVFLCDVDDLERITARARAERAQAVSQAGAIVDEEVARHARERAERRAAPIIQAMRRHASAIAREEVERTVRRLGGDPELGRRLDAMANALVSKLLHAPSTRLRQAGAAGAGGDRLMEAAVEIFGLRGPPPGP